MSSYLGAGTAPADPPATTIQVGVIPCSDSGGRCSSCGSCVEHDGCADEEHPLAEGDCSECGACKDCIGRCVPEAPDPELLAVTPPGQQAQGVG